ncbi:VAMP-associated protein [Annulohypoxylon maeteangense]|uniref:VAMP-associated protein n=1 Tax=Annulohypoxylon maeteangense TaxID=1927788 RepID=UPI0020074409|nr:VAMP-associated protein [Annulohypoxylon maeteangense]KAI0885631.1 VAMP-associated protein [Annulohypoxylon maeteangense]
MSVDIDPQELGFHRPFAAEITETLRIKNPNTHPVAFKVKTTAPKQYCVRPNSGRVEPGKEVEVSVILQAMKQEPPVDAKCRDKFLVQSVPITGDKEFSNLASIWEGIEKSSIQEKKIRVVFLSPKGTPGASHLETPSKSSAANGAQSTPDVAPPAYSSPGEYSGSHADQKSVEEKDTKREEVPTLAAAATVSAAKKSDPSSEELKQQLIQAEKLIAQLKQDKEGLRQRKVTSADGGSGPKPAELAQQDRSGSEGVSVQITALLCFLSFMLAYLFF